MPLETEVIRDGEAVKGIWSYGYFTLSCMYTAAIKDSVPDRKGLIAGDDEKTFGDLPDGKYVDFSMCYIYGLDIPGCGLTQKGTQTLKNRYVFPYDDEFTLVFEKGDVLRAWRSHK